MKVNQLLLLFSVILLPVLSCSRESVQGVSEISAGLNSLTLHYADVYSETDTKTEVGNVSMELLWKSGDAVAVYDASTQIIYKYELDESYNGKVDGQFNLAAGQDTPEFGEHTLYAIYPYDAVSVSGGSLYVELYPEREGGYTYGGAKSGNEAFSLNDIQITCGFTASSLEGNMAPLFNRLVSLMALNVTISDKSLRSETISTVTFKATGIAGKSEVNLSGSTPSLSYNAGDRDAFTLNLATSPRFSATDYVVRFIPMFPVNTLQSASNMGMTFLLENSNVEVGFHRNRNQNFKSGSNTFLDLFEGFYTTLCNGEEDAGDTHLSWWHVAKTSDLAEDSHAGAYADSGLPGSGAGSYGDGAELSD